jgi:hypothetical protein
MTTNWLEVQKKIYQIDLHLCLAKQEVKEGVVDAVMGGLTREAAAAG